MQGGLFLGGDPFLVEDLILVERNAKESRMMPARAYSRLNWANHGGWRELRIGMD